MEAFVSHARDAHPTKGNNVMLETARDYFSLIYSDQSTSATLGIQV
jgi:hypothetical protein